MKNFLQKQENPVFAGLVHIENGRRNSIRKKTPMNRCYHSQIWTFQKSHQCSLWMMIMCIVSVKIKFPIRGQMVKISKITHIFSRLSNRNMISVASFCSICPLMTSLTLSPPTLPLSHSVPATLASLLFPDCTGPLYLLSHAW